VGVDDGEREEDEREDDGEDVGDDIFVRYSFVEAHMVSVLCQSSYLPFKEVSFVNKLDKSLYEVSYLPIQEGSIKEDLVEEGSIEEAYSLSLTGSSYIRLANPSCTRLM
jgi:hypothetical protein